MSKDGYSPESKQRMLAIDTSTAMLTVAVMEGERVLKEVCSKAERNHSLHLVPTIKHVLKELGMGADQVDGIIAGIGPGSYTGVRIGVTAAKTLAWAWNKPVVGVSSLEGLALSGWKSRETRAAAPSGDWIVPLMDARRGQVYTALFIGQESEFRWQREAEDGIRLMRNWVDELAAKLAKESEERQSVPSRIWFVGDVELHRAEAERLREGAGEIVEIVPCEMEARWLGLIGGKRLAAGERDEVHRLVPNYTQVTEAEANLLAKK